MLLILAPSPLLTRYGMPLMQATAEISLAIVPKDLWNDPPLLLLALRQGCQRRLFLDRQPGSDLQTSGKTFPNTRRTEVSAAPAAVSKAASAWHRSARRRDRRPLDLRRLDLHREACTIPLVPCDRLHHLHLISTVPRAGRDHRLHLQESISNEDQSGAMAVSMGRFLTGPALAVVWQS